MQAAAEVRGNLARARIDPELEIPAPCARVTVALTYNQMVVHLANAELNLVFRALADATRRDILRRTAVGEVSVSRLAEDYRMSFAAVQKHVAALEAAGLVHKSPAGRQRLVRADAARVAQARACLELLEDLWRHRLAGLDALLAEPDPRSLKKPME